MKKRWNLLLGGIILGALVFNGCAPGTIGEPPEFNTPTGCHKHRGRYFDPAVKECVQVTDTYQALVLNGYRRVNELAEQNAGEVEFSIYPKRFLTFEEAEMLWSELREQGAEMIVVGGPLPDDRVYDPEGEMQRQWQQEHNHLPRVWGGPHGGAGCGWMEREDAPAETIVGMITESLKTEEKRRSRPELKKAILEDGDCRIRLMHVRADAKVMKEWLDRHLDILIGVQPVVDFLDKRLPSFGPTEPLKEGA